MKSLAFPPSMGASALVLAMVVGGFETTAAPGGAGNVLVFDGDPFLSREVQLVETYAVPDWTSDPGPVPGPVTVTAERWDAVDGWGELRRVSLGVVNTPTAWVWVNQLASDIVFFNFSGLPAPGFPDADGNGLPDAWEVRYFGKVGIDPNGDADGDGLTNREEYLAGSNPVEPENAPLEIDVALVPEAGPGKERVLRFAIPDQAADARLEAVGALGEDWKVTPAVVQEVGGRRFLELPVDPARPAQFFRWRLDAR
ncbi:MAG: hypothetical protein IT581_19230 [Verrucomicrobiales bacterium]|nr:hypothetical protein [Verrucomicrobiales bacterium]